MIDYAELRATTMQTVPYAWALATDACLGSHARSLAETFPTTGFELSERSSGSDKTYRTNDLRVTDLGGILSAKLAHLEPPWLEFLEHLVSYSYRDAVASLSGRDLSGCAPEIRLCRYGPGCWIDPHTDRADKLVTQVWYFNEVWDSSWGGALRVLSSAADDDVHTSVRPGLGCSTVINVSDRSWHSVEKVSSSAPTERCSALVHFVQTGARDAAP